MMKRVPIAASTAIFLFAAFAAQSAVAETASVTSTVNLRNGPGTTFTSGGKIPAGAAVEVGECKGQWCQVTWQGQSGYVIASSLVEGGALPPGKAASRPGAGAPPPGTGPGDDAPPPGAGAPPPGAVAGGGPPPPDYYGPPPAYPYPYYYGGYYGPYYGGYYGPRYGYGRRRW